MVYKSKSAGIVRFFKLSTDKDQDNEDYDITLAKLAVVRNRNDIQMTFKKLFFYIARFSLFSHKNLSLSSGLSFFK